MLEIIMENKKIVGILFAAAVIIIIGIVWLPKNTEELGYYENISEEEIDTKVIKQYGDELQLAIYLEDINFLQEKILPEYMEYNEISMNDYEEWLLANNMLSTNISFGKTSKSKYGNETIYSIDTTIGGRSQKINIIETYPEKWYYTFDNFVHFSSEAIEYGNSEYGVIINNIYQDINYIKFNISIYVKDENTNNIDLSKSDSIKLNMEDNTSYIMATNNYDSEYVPINGKKYVTVDCIFNIPINEQKNIESIVIDSVNINNYERSMEVKVDL